MECKGKCYLTVKQFAYKHKWPIGGIRHLIFQSPKGFDRCVFRVGRKILIEESAFFEWVESRK